LTPNGCGNCIATDRINLLCTKTQTLSILDYQTTESITTVKGLNSPLSPYAVITLQLWFTHTWNGDCELRLYVPDGTYIVLSNRRGGSNDNVFNGALFTDSAATSADSYSYSNNVVATPIKPENPFSTLRGKNSNGDWKLWIQDYAGGDTGTLTKFILNIQGNFNFEKKKNNKQTNKYNRWVLDRKSMWNWNLCFNRCHNIYM